MIMSNVLKKNKLIVFVGLVYLALYVLMPDQASKAVGNSVYYLLEMFEVLPIIFLLTVVLEALVPKEMIIKHFGENSGFVGNLLSLLLGSISAGPIYAAFPISKMLISKGASITNVVIILSSWAVVKLPMLANEAKFLGVKFMIVRWSFTVVAIFIMAYMTALLVKKEDIPSEAAEAEQKVLHIKEAYCIGCGLCVKMLPEHYKIAGKKAVVIAQIKQSDMTDLIRESARKCPTQAIYAMEE